MGKPNSHAQVVVKNNWGSKISDVRIIHRYDTDHTDMKNYSSIEDGATTSSFTVGFWTGFARTGKDYWYIEFKDNSGGSWDCKTNFYCYLTSDDVGGTVTLEVSPGNLRVTPPVSSLCDVALHSKPNPGNTDNRPVYVIGHRCNDVEDIGIAISKGANALECDLQYNESSNQIFVNHDLESGTTFQQWLAGAKIIKDQNPTKFALIIFDCKFAASISSMDKLADVMVDVRTNVRNFLNNDSTSAKINTVYSIASFDHRAGFNKIKDGLESHEGIAIDQSDEPAAVQSFFADNSVNNCWYGDGIASIIPKNVFPEIKEGGELRDQNEIIKKVYVWTLAKESSISEFINSAHTDGVMVNIPGTLDPISPTGLSEALKVVNESGAAHMAVRSDPAFKVYRRP
ncbi:MAG: hypothetical protein AB8H03_23725 [Saprospiraceae bacterium]